jgi:TRAP-type mannitol/chloroaromatic compound transport system permease small subunit
MLALSHTIDTVNERIGRAVYWLVLATVLISAANATVRKVFNYSSNSFLEIQWYLFSIIFLFCAGYTLKHNEHVRIDIITSRFSARVRAGIDVFGTIFFLLPTALLVMWLSWPLFVDAYVRQEVSTNAGGLIVWPARLLVPVGFFLLAMQAISELIKRIAFLRGMIADPGEKVVNRTTNKALEEGILRTRNEHGVNRGAPPVKRREERG